MKWLSWRLWIQILWLHSFDWIIYQNEKLFLLTDHLQENHYLEIIHWIGPVLFHRILFRNLIFVSKELLKKGSHSQGRALFFQTREWKDPFQKDHSMLNEFSEQNKDGILFYCVVCAFLHIKYCANIFYLLPFSVYFSEANKIVMIVQLKVYWYQTYGQFMKNNRCTNRHIAI